MPAGHRGPEGVTAAAGSSAFFFPICSPFLEARARSRCHTSFQASLAFGDVVASEPVLSQPRGFNTAGVFSIIFAVTWTCHLLSCSRSEGLLTSSSPH